MNTLSKWICGVLFVVGMGIGLGATEAGYTNYSYPYTNSYTSNPVINSNAYWQRNMWTDCLMYGNCQNNGGNYYQQPSYYPQQDQGYADNSINNSFNTVNNIDMDYQIDNKHYYDYQYNYRYDIRDSYNQTTKTTNTTHPSTVITPPPVVNQPPVIYHPKPPTQPTRPTHPTKPVPPTTNNCSSVYQPVCGANGASYSNSCVAQQAKVRVACQGLCPCNTPTPPTVPTYQCKSGETMVRWKNQCHQGYGATCYQRPDSKRCTRKGTTPPPEECDQEPEQVCSVLKKTKRGDKYMSQLGLTIPTSLQHINQYRIQWFNGTWSQWYTPGQNDIDWKNNCGTWMYPSTSCARRVWSYFDDHTYEIKTCTIKYPTHNTCRNTTNYYHTTTQQPQPSNYAGYTAPSSNNGYTQPSNTADSYAIQRHNGPTSSPAASNSIRHNSPDSQWYYGRNNQGNYFANEKTYGIVETVNNTFR